MKIMFSRTSKAFNLITSAALLLSCSHAVGQSTPPMMVQVPFVSVAAGNIVSGAASATLSASCTTGLPIMGTSTTGSPTSADNYGDGCLANQAILSAPWGAAIDAWGNIYFSDQGHKYVRVIYAGAVTVGGVLNPAAAMISAAYGSRGVTPVAGNVYGVAGGYSQALTQYGTAYYCTNDGNGSVAGSADGADCPATYSYIGGPYAPAVDSAGNLFIVDRSIKVVYEVVANTSSLGAQLVTIENPAITSPQIGYIYKIASGGGYLDKVLANTGGTISSPYGVAVDASDNLYVADYTNSAIRMINGPGNSISGGVGPGFIHTIAGNCTATACTALAGAPASNTQAVGAAFLDPMAIAVDSYGNVYVGDNNATSATVPSTVRVIYAGGANNPVANLICVENAAIQNCPASLVANNVYTVAGSGNSSNSSAVGNGALATAPAIPAVFDKIQGLALDSHGNIYVADYSSHGLIAEVNATTGYLTFLAGDAAAALAVGNNCASGATAGNGPTMSDNYGDGCPATESVEYHIEGNPAIDSSGNLYFTDSFVSGSASGGVRKLTFNNSFPPTNVGSPASQNIAFTLLTGTTVETASNVSVSVLTQGTASPEFTSPGGTGDTCSGTATSLEGFLSSSNSMPSSSTVSTTCVVPINFKPAQVGVRSGAVQITATLSVNGTVKMTPANLNGIGNGPALAIDPGTVTTLGSGTAPQGVATDSSGNTYIAWASGTVASTPGGTLATPIVANTVNPHQMAVDGAGNVYVADTGNNRIAEFVVGATAAVDAVSGLSAPQGVALDAASNLYIADTGNGRVLFQPNGNGVQTLLGAGFTTPVAVAVDAGNNVYVADSGLGEIVKIADGTQTTVLSGIAPVSLAVDAAGNLEYVDASSKQVVQIPVSGSSVTVAGGLNTPVGVALDPNGNLYVADTANTGISYYNRAIASQALVSGTPQSATLTNIGNQNYTGTMNQTDSTDFDVAVASGSCSTSSSFTLDFGMACGLASSVTGTGNDTVSFSGNSAVLNLVAMVGTTTTVGNLTSTSSTPTYGDTITVTATVTAAGGSNFPTGAVSFTVDKGVATSAYPLTNGSYTYTLPALAAGNHSVSATYTSTGNFSGSSTASPLNFAVAPIAVTATANSITVAEGQPIPTITGSLSGVLPQDQTNVTAEFSTTATSSSQPGSYPITVQLTGAANSNYTVTLSGNPTVTINANVVGTTIALSGLSPASPVYGQSVSVVATVSAVSGTNQPTGTVSFTVDGTLQPSSCTLGSGTCTFTFASLGAGQHNVSATYSSTGNFSSSSTNSPLNFSITPLGVTATANPVTATYGQAIPAITGSLSGVLPQDQGNVAAVFSSTATSTSSVGSYPISVQLTGATGNYTVTLSGNAAVTIQVASVTVTVNNATRAYGSANPLFSGAIAGVLPQDLTSLSATYSTTATSASGMGTYPITAIALTGSAAGNYTLGVVTPGTLTISALAITATANPVTAIYGQAIPGITGLLTGVLPQDQGNVIAVFSTTATATSPAASYPISVQLSGLGAGNYTVTLSGTAAVTVQAAGVTLIVNNATRAYGSANPVFSGTILGVLSQDQANVSATYSTTATAASPVGTYPITATALSGTASTNYTLGVVTPGTFTISALAITATSNPATMKYGQAPPTITGSLSGVLSQDQGNVAAVFSTTATATSPVGFYPIVVQLSGPAAGNYTATVSGAPTVAVQPAVVTAAANSATREYGAANPALTGVILTGVLPQDAGNVAAIFSTTATSASPVGAYPIASAVLTGSAASNYSVGAITPGILTVTQAASNISLTTSATNVPLSGQVTFTATVASTTSGTPTGSVTFSDGTVVLATVALANNTATNTQTLTTGTHTISAIYSGDEDFAGSPSNSITETVQLPLVVVSNPPTSPITINSGSTGTVTLDLTAQGGYTGTATMSCAQLPVGMSCSFNPSTATFSATSSTATTTITISTAGLTATAQMSIPRAPGKGDNLAAIPAFCFWVPGSIVGFIGLRRKKKLSSFERCIMRLIVVGAFAIGVSAISGCGGSSGPVKTTPATYTINVEISAGTIQSIPLSVIVH